MNPEETLGSLRGSKLLSIQDYGYIQPIDGHGSWNRLASEEPLNEYDKNYAGKLKDSLGIELCLVNSSEMMHGIGRASPEEAESIANQWIDEAEDILNITREDVVRSASLYIACRELLSKYDGDAITISSWALLPNGELEAMPPLAEMELTKDKIPCCCESLIDCLASQMIGMEMAGRPAFVGDQVSNWGGLRKEDAIQPLGDNYVAIGHCYAPVNPHGHDRVPYVIRDHAYYELGWGSTIEERASWRKEDYLAANRKLEKKNITLTALRVGLPFDEPVTIAKFDPYNKTAQISGGKTFDPHPFFEDFDNTVCRTKMAIETDEPFENLLGGHLVGFYGDLSEQFRAFADAADYQVLEPGE